MGRRKGKYKISGRAGGKGRDPRMAVYFFDDYRVRLSDSEEEDSFPELEDPEEEDSFPELEDPSSYRGARRRLRNAAFCGDFPTGLAANVGRGAKQELSGNIIVRLAPRLALAAGGSLEDLAAQADLPGLLSVIEKYQLGEKSRRLVAGRGSVKALNQDLIGAATKLRVPDRAPEPREVTPQEIVALESTVANNPLAPLHSLATYWRLDAGHRPGKLKKILKQLNKLAEVSLAYPEVTACDPSNGMSDTFAGSQGYLDRAPYGIDARWARKRGGDGSGVALVDLEQGWMPDHPELRAKAPVLIHGNNRHGQDGYLGNHGTAVLGEIAAAGNGFGVVGIAPGVAKIGLSSHYHSESRNQADSGLVPKSDSHVAEAIHAAISSPGFGEKPFLEKGDVLLIETQRGYLPTEIDPADFDAIRLASALGIIVVEAAGNGGRDLDRYRDRRGAIFNRRSGSFRESGAIMVGAALSALPHKRKRSSNYGSRVDCYAWGNRVVTCGYGDLYVGGQNDAYTADFTNTSAAAPIIAGAALILQGMYQIATKTASAPQGRRLRPSQMRALLADPATGTRQGGGVRGHIGVMPNLRAIVENTLRIVPDVYLRDSIADTGAVPAALRACACPDVLVSQSRLADPAKSFGEGSDRENDLTAGNRVVPGRDNFLYVRMKNRGRRDAGKMAATVYWSETATLITPDRWHEIGCCDAIEVPQGDTLAVAGPIPWTRVPSHDTFCLAALIEGGGEPTRLPPGLMATEGAVARRKRRGWESEPTRFDWRAYLAFTRRHNHFAVRNLHVVGTPAAGAEKRLGFLITGTPEGDRGRFFDLEILQKLPVGAELCLDVPLALAPALRALGGSWQESTVGGGRFLSYCLPAIPRVPVCGVALGAGAEHGCYFTVRGVAEMRQGGHGIAIRQLYRGQEVGRVTWQFH